MPRCALERLCLTTAFTTADQKSLRNILRLCNLQRKRRSNMVYGLSHDCNANCMFLRNPCQNDLVKKTLPLHYIC